MDEAELLKAVTEAMAAQQGSPSGASIATILNLLFTFVIGAILNAIRGYLSRTHQLLTDIKEICEWLQTEHLNEDSCFSTSKILPLMERMIKRDSQQHTYNRWTHGVFMSMVKSLAKLKGEDGDDAGLSLGPVPNGD